MYVIDTGEVADPLRRRYAHHAGRVLDVDAMCSAAQVFVGTHDFTQFSNRSPAGARRSPIKTLEAFTVAEQPDGADTLVLQV
jgi:tRNA pseudouridine38-40 synthase